LTSNIASLSREIKKAAQAVAYQWPGVVEADDLEQDISVKLLESTASLYKVLGFDDKGKINALIQIGHQIAAQERTDYEIFSGNFKYSVNEVKKLLTDRALHNESPGLGSNWSISDKFSKGGEFEDAVLNKSSAETDLKRGMKKLKATNSAYAEIIERRYLRDELIPKDEEGARTRLSRALTSLTTNMNRSYKQRHAARSDGPGTRKVVSSAGAKAISNTNYSGDYWYPNPGKSDRFQYLRGKAL
jgi:hypothetical protein